MLTPVEKQKNFFVKREDKANWTSLDYPSGSKVRQYANMAQPGVPMIVGCASSSAMQIYVAAAAKQANVPGVIYVPKNKIRTDATRYAMEMGAEVIEVHPGYMSVLRARARGRAREIGKTVRWDIKGAVADAAAQTENLPVNASSVVVATGSGLTVAGIMAGLVKMGRTTPVVAVAVSNLADYDRILDLARQHLGVVGRINEPSFPKLIVIRHPQKYTDYVVDRLPDGTPLDPFYAAKAMEYVGKDDVLWVPGLRPVRSMPLECRREFADWQGFTASK